MANDITRRTVLGAGIASLTAGAAGGLLPRTSSSAFAATAPAGEPILIGHQCDLTGWDAATGYWRDKTATAMVGWINANGGIAGRPVKLITVDTKSDVDVGVNQLRQLILENKVDAVLGSELTSISLASGKLADENKTLYLTLSTAAETTNKEHARPYQFRLTTNSGAESTGAAKQLVDAIGKRWTVLYSDYAWGQSERDWWTKGVARAGGGVVNPVAVPLDAQDLFPYVGKLDRATDGIYIPVLNALQTVNGIRSAGLNQQIVLAGVSFSLLDFRELGDSGEGVWGIETAPLELADMPGTQMANVYQALGLDEKGVEKTSGKVAGVSEILGVWQSLGFLKENIEKSGWKGKADSAALIKRAEATSAYPLGPLFPMGDITMRAQDHQAFMDLYVVRIDHGRLLKKAKVAKEQTVYDAEVDLTKS